MAMIKVVEIYKINLQAQDAKNFVKDGKSVSIEARKAREATVVIGETEEYRVPFILPEHFDPAPVTVGCFLNVQCAAFESLQPFQIKNVNRVLPAKGK